jgi:hypothetical protein
MSGEHTGPEAAVMKEATKALARDVNLHPP